MRFLRKFRLPIVIFALLIVTLGLARLFSGPEDTWIRNDRGEWVQHGHPAGPKPSDDYSPPSHEKILPLVLLFTFIIPVIFIGLHKQKSSLNYENAVRDIRFLGYIGTASLALGVCIITGVFFIIGTDPNVDAEVFGAVVLLGLAAFAMLSIVLGALALILKHNRNDHYRLERRHQEIIDLLQQIRNPETL